MEINMIIAPEDLKKSAQQLANEVVSLKKDLSALQLRVDDGKRAASLMIGLQEDLKKKEYALNLAENKRKSL